MNSTAPGATSRFHARLKHCLIRPRSVFRWQFPQQNASTHANVDSSSHHTEKNPQLISQLRDPLCGGATWHVEGRPPRPSTACREVKGNPSTPTRLPPQFSRVQSIPTPSVTDDPKANHHLNAQQKWMEKFSPTHGSFKIRSNEGKMLGESLHQI